MGSENLGKADGKLRQSPSKIGFLSFFRVGVFTFGGYAMLPIIQRELVDRRRWLDTRQFTGCLAVAQAGLGAIAATLNMTNPPEVVVKFLLGIRPTVVALIDSGDSPSGDTDKEDQPNSDTAVRRTAGV